MTDAVREAFERWMSEDGKWPDAVAHRYGHYVLAQTESAWKAWQAALSEPPTDPSIESDELVICPECCTQFRAIPVQVQRLLLASGHEPPFTAHPAPVEQVHEQLAEAVRDAERLTYLEGDEMKRVFKIGKTWYWKPAYGMPHRKAKTLREAIDAALSGEQP